MKLYSAVILATAFIAAHALPAQSPARAAFVFVVGTDTVGVERFTRGAQDLTGEVTMRGQPRISYRATIESPGRIGSLGLTVFSPGSAVGARPLQRATLRSIGDSVIMESIASSGATRTQRLASESDAMTLLNSSFAMIELAVERARQSPGDSVSFPIFLTTGGQTYTATLTNLRSDSLLFRLGPVESHLVMQANRLVRVRVPSRNLVTYRVEGAAVATLALGKPDYSAPEGAPYTAQSVRVPTPAGHVLAGTLTMPRDATRPVPAVVTITGSGAQDRDESIPIVPGFRLFRQVADTLGHHGIAVLRMDDRGYGESGGDFASATTADFADDIRAAVQWLRAREDVDPGHIILIGHSEGGIIAPMVAATDTSIAGIVLLAGPSYTGQRVIDYQFRQALEADTSITAASLDSVAAVRLAAFQSAAVQNAWMTFFLSHDPLPVASKVSTTPVLILQGATDRQVTAEQATELAAAFRAGGNENVTVRVYPDLNHLFLYDPDGSPAGYARLENVRVGPDVLGEIVDWVRGSVLPR